MHDSAHATTHPAGAASLDGHDESDVSLPSVRAVLPVRWLKAMAQWLPQPGRGDEALHVASDKDWARSVLAREAFEQIVDRERNLADRGSRLFTLVVLRRTQGSRHALRTRLRTTDVVGRLGDDRIGVLLSDTDPVGAGFLTSWVDTAQARHRLEVAATIFVYPSVQEAVERYRRDRDPRGGGGAAGGPPAVGPAGRGATNGRAAPNGRAASKGYAGPNGHNELELRAHVGDAARWPMQDLWGQLTVPMPLWKRGLDVLISSILLILLLPLFVIIAILISLDSPGSPIYRQVRVGRGGRLFPFFKFRSMTGDADAHRSELEAQNEQDGPIFKLRNDPRVTRVGRVLRRWSLDELPQLWNVFRGDISLVGPRSPTPNEVPYYERWQRRRLMVTGGLTCTWQVGGRSEIPFREWMRMDLRYIERRSMLYDFWLLARTVPAVLTGRGAH